MDNMVVMTREDLAVVICSCIELYIESRHPNVKMDKEDVMGCSWDAAHSDDMLKIEEESINLND